MIARFTPLIVNMRSMPGVRPRGRRSVRPKFLMFGPSVTGEPGQFGDEVRRVHGNGGRHPPRPH